MDLLRISAEDRDQRPHKDPASIWGWTSPATGPPLPQVQTTLAVCILAESYQEDKAIINSPLVICKIMSTNKNFMPNWHFPHFTTHNHIRIV